MASNIYLKFENPTMNGASTDPGHQGEIEVLSWSQGSTPASLSFTKYLDASSSDLLNANYSGKQFGKATLTLFRREVLLLTVVLEHVTISNLSISGGPGDTPVEDVTLDYGTVKYEYHSS